MNNCMINCMMKLNCMMGFKRRVLFRYGSVFTRAFKIYQFVYQIIEHENIFTDLENFSLAQLFTKDKLFILKIFLLFCFFELFLFLKHDPGDALSLLLLFYLLLRKLNAKLTNYIEIQKDVGQTIIKTIF